MKDTIPAPDCTKRVESAECRGEQQVAAAGGSVAGRHAVPGDKSITHRALMFAAMARGRSTVTGALTSLDARSTARVLRDLGATISPLRSGVAVSIDGRGGLTGPRRRLDCGNSGTTARLMTGLVAAHPFTATLTGDPSLRRRPMRRVTEPLRAMGAVIPADQDRLPLTIIGGNLRSLDWEMTVASAQIKSAILLGGMAASVPVTIREPAPSRDHTERLLRHFGYQVDSTPGVIRFLPGGRVVPHQYLVPGDPSSAAFLVAAALLAGRGEIAVSGVCLNEGRTGFIEIARRMGGVVDSADVIDQGGEPVGEIRAASSKLRAVGVGPEEVPAAVDEIPILACLAARAEGESRFDGLAELRVKESDRLELMATNLRNVGVDAAVDGDSLTVVGSDRPLAGRVVTAGDHRIAMAFQVLGRSTGCRIEVDDPGCADVSFPGFAAALAGLYSGEAR